MRNQLIENAANRIEGKNNPLSKKQPRAARLFRSIAERSDANGFVRMSQKGIEHLYDGEELQLLGDVGLLLIQDLQPIYNSDMALVGFAVTCLQPKTS